MRPDHPDSVVNPEGEDLDALAEADRPPQPLDETEEMEISDEQPAPAAPDPMRTGPGSRNPPPSEPLAPVSEHLHNPPTRMFSPAQRPGRTGPRQPNATARLPRRGADQVSQPGDGPRKTKLDAKPDARPDAKPDAKPAPPRDSNVGKVLGSYRVLESIGEGGMGKVYRAEHIKLGRKVALKLLRPEYSVKRDAVGRFFKEAQAVNKIRHENIVDITDFVELESGETFIIMELLEGSDLADLTRKVLHPMPLDRAMRIALEVCDALAAAHLVGVIHRDLKPDNIFVMNTATRKDFVKLLDFGVAKLLGEPTDADGWQTAAGSVIGTPAYMSPEQASGIPVDARSDIYSLGAILYELFTGHPVFKAKSFGEFVIKHMNDDPVPPRDLANAPRIPAALERVILRCLEKDPDLRYSTVTELREDLARATATATGNTVQTLVETNPLGRTMNARRRRRMLISLPIAGGVVALAAAAFWLASGLGSLEEAPRPRDPLPAGNTPEQVKAEPLPPVKGATARIRLDTIPPGADVFRKGDPRSLGRTPLDLRLHNIGGEVEFVYRLSGYQDARERVLVVDDALYSLSLEKKTGPSAKPGGGKVRHLVKGHKDRRPAREKTLSEPKGTEDRPRGTEGKPRRTEGKPRRTEGKPRGVNPEDQVDPFGQ